MRNIFTFFSSFLLLVTLFTTFLFADEKNLQLESIHFAGSDDVAEVIEFRLSEKVTPSKLRLQGSKPRAVFDFINFTYPASQKRIIEVDGQFIKRIRVGIHNTPVVKIRVVIDLVDKEVFVNEEYSSDTNVLKVTVGKEKSGFPKVKKDVISQQQKVEEIGLVAETTIMPVKKKKKTSKTGAQISKEVDLPQKKMKSAPSSLEQVESKNVPQNQVKERQSPEVSQSIETASSSSTQVEIEKEKPVLQDLRFESSSNDKEMVLFTLSGFFPPVVFAAAENNLRVVCDFLDGTLDKSVKQEMVTGGKYIEKVRVITHNSPEKVRVVLELAAQYNYDLKQVFFKEDNLFVIIISNMGEKK